MGCGSFSASDYKDYSVKRGRSYDSSTGRTSGQSFTQRKFDSSLNPRNFKVRECVNSEEHPNTIPVILGLDVTGSMGAACKETADALGVIMTNLYKKFKDIEFCIMGIGDLAYDEAPIQMSQFESDVRIAESLDKIWLENGGGGNAYESYTAAWYMGLHRTKLDCWEQNRKGIIITMGDEPMNPYLPAYPLGKALGSSLQGDVESNELYAEASKKFDIFHIAIDDKSTSFVWYKDEIQKSFGGLIGSRLRISTIQNLAKTIEECITESIQGTVEQPSSVKVSKTGKISW